MEYWIARDKNDDLYLYDFEPTRNPFGSWESSGNYYEIGWRLFPEITYENSPKKISVEFITK